jgi:hypothetical protein
MSVTFYFGHGEPSVNMANGNAGAILRLLGYPTEELCGELEPCALVSRIDHVLRSGDYTVAVRPTVQDRNITYCGIDAEYVVNRLFDLRAVAEAAQDHDSPVFYA